MEQKYKEKKSFRRYFYLTFTVAFIIAFILLFTISVNNRDKAFEKLKKNETGIVNIESDKITRELIGVLSDLKYLHNAFKYELLDLSEDSNVDYNWKEFSIQKGVYDQIRFIDINGNERIRINKDDDGCYIVSDENLQNKSDRYYFKKTIALKEGDFYISPLDLNIENSEIEIPYKPVLRLGTPLYDDYGNIKGVIIINYLVSDLLSLLKTVSIGSEGSISLLDDNGYYLLNEDKEKEWGFMFEDSQNINFVNEYPSEWHDISGGRNQIISENGLFFSNKLELKYIFFGDFNSHVEIEDDNLFVISHIVKNDETSYFFIDSKIALLWYIIKSKTIAFIFIIVFSTLVSIIIIFNNKYYSKIKYFSQYDSLTNAYNRGYGLSQLEKVISNDNKKNYPLSICYIDINGLKEVNDSLGHKEGSILIKNVVKKVILKIDIDDFIVRLGGDEFLIILKGKNEKQAELIWQSIVNEYAKINNEMNFEFLISVSHGILELDKNNKVKTHDVLHDVDQRMYVEKKMIKSHLKTVLKRR